MISLPVCVTLPAPFSQLHLSLPHSATVADLPLPPQLCTPSTYLRTRSSGALAPSTPLVSLRQSDDADFPIELQLGVRLLGGKGGFGSQLRAAGGRMSSGKNTNIDACRDLSGRRLSTIKEAQRQAELLESAPQLRAQAVAAEKAKLEALERTLGISNADDANPTASSSGEGSSSKTASSSAVKRIAEVDVEEIARKKHRFDDNKFFEESREIKDNVRSAVAAGLLKKKKKPKAEVETKAEDAKGKGKGKEVSEGQKVKDKVAMPPPAVAKTATVA
ncbi:telomere stability and silencing-domain-containing protein [Papiliotrema laurentii]|uniref:Telomere stability and silencing-domain-containing protein n=1 Tax=Papiliotrema laurentii TaxID=5418 RepID=A0AAD9D0C3_PAPLA|nr:telomere stability and silencing-domain-containing protein [Papiliotrema laurentii]